MSATVIRDPYQLAQPPPWTPTPPAAAPGGDGSTPRQVPWVLVVSVVVAALVVIAVGVVGWNAGWFGGAPSQAAPTAPTVESPVAPPVSTPEVTVTQTQAPALTPEQERDAAFATLEQLVADDARMNPVRGQWVAQLASKTEGISDPTQQPTPFTLQDILAEIRRHQANASYGSQVRVIHLGDWGTTQPGPTPMWVTVADLNLSSQAEVQAWCERTFTLRGEPLLNICFPRQLTPKGQ